MSKVLKTGDVKRYPSALYQYIAPGQKWAVLREQGYVAGRWSRAEARLDRAIGERIARILSIGPKLVTVRIEK